MSGYTDLTKMETSRNRLRRLARHDEPQFSKDSIVNVMERFVKTVNVMDDTILVPCRLMDRQIGDSTDIIPPPGKDSTSNQHSVNGRRNAKNSKNIHDFLSSSELFNLYNMLNALKNDLLWTGKKENDDEDDDEEYGNDYTRNLNGLMINENLNLQMENSESKTDITAMVSGATSSSSSTSILTPTPTSSSSLSSSASAVSVVSTIASAPIKGHTRCPSTASVASTASVSAISDSESEISNENDSGVESESNKNGSAASSSSNSSVEGCMPAKKNGNLDKATELAKRTRRHLNGLYKCLEQMTEAANYLTARYQSDIGPV